MDPNAERRRYPRLKANVLCRAVGAWAAGPRRKAIDLSRGGIRVYSDEPHPIAERLEIEVLLPDGVSVVTPAVVAWVETLPRGAPAAYDIGLQFVDLPQEAATRLDALLEPGPE